MKYRNLILGNNVENTNLHLAFFMFAQYINSIKTLLLFQLMHTIIKS